MQRSSRAGSRRGHNCDTWPALSDWPGCKWPHGNVLLLLLLLVLPRLSVGGKSYVLWLSLPSPPQACSEGIAVVLCFVGLSVCHNGNSLSGLQT